MIDLTETLTQEQDTMNLLQTYFSKVAETERSSAAIAFLASLDHIGTQSPTIRDAILRELGDQRSYLKMIASENYSSLAVQLAMGNLLTDKYAEGIPYHRFYAGCEHIDTIESEAIQHATTLFGADHAYVQPHSGADANLVAFWSILMQRVQSKEIERLHKKTIDELNESEYESVRQLIVNQKILALSLNSGGHLTHGYRHNMSSKMMQAFFYEVDPITEMMDYSHIQRQAKMVKPAILLAGYSAHPRKINFRKMKEIADSVGATFMVDMAHFAGLVAGKVFTGDYDPIPFADIVTSTTHKTLRGPRGGLILAKNQFKEFIDKGCPLVLGGPLPHVIAAKSLAFQEARAPSFQTYAAQVVLNAHTLAEALKKRGARIVTGGTENHLIIVDVSGYNITGRQAENALRQAKITCNRNAIPNDKNGPWYTSGVRLGTPALTTLGMGTQEMEEIADIIVTCLRNTKPAPTATGAVSRAHSIVADEITDELQARTQALLSRFPLYREIVVS